MPTSNPRSVYQNPDALRSELTDVEDDESDIISIPPPPGIKEISSFYSIDRFIVGINDMGG